jgi:hypothetical protein
MQQYRVIEDESGVFYPQTRRGWLRRWRLLSLYADVSTFMWESAIVTDDPEDAARFCSARLAEEFISRVQTRTNRYWEKVEASKRRTQIGVQVKRVIKPHDG